MKNRPKTMPKIMPKNDAKISLKKCVIKWSKSGQNLSLKIYFIMLTMGGSKNVKNRQFSVRGVRRGHFINFLKLSHFLQKRSRFRPPKSTPKVGLLKIPFPTKTPVLLLQWGSENVIFGGGPGRTGFCKKGRHYYIAIFDFLVIFGPHNFINFHPAISIPFF
jgi:hypothetical protein